MEQEIPLHIQWHLFRAAARTANWAYGIETHLRGLSGYNMSFQKNWPYSHYRNLFFQDGFLQGHRLQFIQTVMNEVYGWVTTFEIKHTRDSVFIYLVFHDKCMKK